MLIFLRKTTMKVNQKWMMKKRKVRKRKMKTMNKRSPK
jgi:hypothetical protein